jgi:ATP-binding cassette subfamily C protein
VLHDLSFSLRPGDVLGVIGPSGSGKSTLARALCGGAIRPSTGALRFDGATLEQYDQAVLGRHIGYLPQRVSFFDGTIADNIARLAREPDAEKTVRAGKAAGIHDVILRLPNGYDTHLSTVPTDVLSGGQMQRLALARALYGEPSILVLDEPDAHLDTDGAQALAVAIGEMKARGKTIVIMAHRPSAILACDLLLVLEGGKRKAFGPRDVILRDMMQRPSPVLRFAGRHGGVE